MTFLPVLLLLLLLRPDQFCFLYHQSPLMLVSMASSHSSVYWFEKKRGYPNSEKNRLEGGTEAVSNIQVLTWVPPGPGR